MAIAEILPPENKKNALGGVPITRKDRLLPAQASATSNGQEAEASKPVSEVGMGLALAASRIRALQSSRAQKAPEKKNEIVVDRVLDGEYLQETGLAPINKNTSLAVNPKKEPLKTASELLNPAAEEAKKPKPAQERPQGNTNNHQHDFHHAVEDSHNFATKHGAHAIAGPTTHLKNGATILQNLGNHILDGRDRSRYGKESAAWEAKERQSALDREDFRDMRQVQAMASMMSFVSSMGKGGTGNSQTPQQGVVS